MNNILSLMIVNNSLKNAFDSQVKILKDIFPYLIVIVVLLIAGFSAVLFLFMKKRQLNKNLENLVAQRTNDLELQAVKLGRRIDQQKLMADLSQNFISGGDIDELITRSLQMTGEFMGISRILLEKYEKQALYNLYEWRNPSENVNSILNVVMPLSDMEDQLADAFRQKAITHFSLDDIDREEIIERYGLDLTTALFMPIFIDDELWGALEFNQCEGHVPWTTNDINLGEMIAGILSGVMSRLQMEARLARLSAIVESSSQLITIISDDGMFEYVNPAAAEITGYSREELLAKGQRLLIDDTTIRYIREEVLPVIYEVGKQNYEVSMTRKDGEIRVMSVSGFTVGADVRGRGVIAMDITENRRLENDLIQAKELAEQSSKAKSEFLSRMSHEIRTPLNAIIGMIGIAKNTEDMAKIRHCHERADNASKHLLSIINDILDMSKIEAEKFELFGHEFDFEKMLMNITSVTNFRAEEKSQNLVVNLGGGVPAFIFSDELRLSQVITNLLTNAVKFTPEGGTVVLSIEKTGDTDNEVTLKIAVADNGIGISEEQKNRLFTSFEQADGSISRKFGGTGLGLSISKRIVELMGGRIWIESELGHGSKFIFEIKAQKGKQKTYAKLKINRNNVRILVVDDCAEIRAYFSHVMTAHNLPCDVAGDGFEALDMIKNCKDKPYNVFFVDWQMPGMNGIELTKKIKEITDKNSVVIMISIAEWNSIEKEAIAAGVKQFIPKPLFPSLLINAINECFGSQSIKGITGGNLSLNNSLRNFANHTILIAEDVEVNREIIAAVLEETDISIDFAENGAIAVSMFEKHADKYSLILMDIHMPEMDGFEATRRIRALELPQAKDVPIIAMTANVFREDVENCLAAGMNNHIGKPMDTDDLFAKLDQYLPLVTDESKKAVPGISVHTADAGFPDYAGFLPSIDVTDGLRRLMNNKVLYFKLLKNFKCREMADELIKHINDANTDKTALTAHAIRGVASNLGFSEIVNVVSCIENQAKAGTDSHHMLDSLNRAVNEALAAIIKLLKEYCNDKE